MHVPAHVDVGARHRAEHGLIGRRPPDGVRAVRIFRSQSQIRVRRLGVEFRDDRVPVGHRQFIRAKRRETLLCIHVERRDQPVDRQLHGKCGAWRRPIAGHRAIFAPARRRGQARLGVNCQ
ncbi:Uncharacterised protein [Bordetella pertussis]|nr:Uncharacterised protein [Bordetella pertussis]